MTPHYQDNRVTLHHGNCLDVLRELPDCSVDAVVTDPPYGLANTTPEKITETVIRWANGERDYLPGGKGFMGNPWDSFVPPAAVWDDCLRVLKPGGHVLAFAGSRTVDLMTLGLRMGGFEIRDSIAWMHGQGFPKGKGQLKPAHEPIVMARKKPTAPRTGLLNIDGCRIAGEPVAAHRQTEGEKVALGRGWGEGYQRGDAAQTPANTAGRWPANVVLDESQAQALDQQSGVSKKSGTGPLRRNTALGMMNDDGWQPQAQEGVRHGGEGGASRFFYVAKAGKSERPNVDGVAHPTVKPLALMRWLVRLVTPPGGTVLEPFSGSGTTIEAALLEGFNVIGIEREAEYLPLIEARIARALATDSALFGGAA